MKLSKPFLFLILHVVTQLLVKSTALTLLSASHDNKTTTNNRRALLFQFIPAAASTTTVTAAAATTTFFLAFPPAAVLAKCSDIESCREIGERKVEQDMKDNPVINLGSGLRYKVIKPGFGTITVGGGSSSSSNDDDNNTSSSSSSNNDVVDLIFSITQASGSYMYSRGFGFEKMNIGGALQSDAGLDSLKVKIGNRDVPVGIERAIVGMKKGERRRVELPPGPLGFVSSEGRPAPTTTRGKTQIEIYKRLLAGNGSTQPGFPAPTIWDIEVLSIK